MRTQLRAKARRCKVPIMYALRILCSKRRASLRGYLTLLWLRYCIATRARADPDDVDDVSGLSKAHGPDGAMADVGCVGVEMSQPRSARELRPCMGPACR